MGWTHAAAGVGCDGELLRRPAFEDGLRAASTA
jgi:hypothetical protein